MTDTSPEVAARLRAHYGARTPAQRVQMATSLFTSAKVLVRAGIRMQLGDIPEGELRRRLFLRLYGDEFSESERSAILRAIARVP